MANKLKAIRKELGLQDGPGLIYGYFEKYLISINQKDKQFELFVDAEIDENDRTVIETLRDFIKTNASSYGIKNSSLSNTGLSLIISDKKGDELVEFFYLLVNQMKMLHIAGSEYCSNCGAPLGDDSVILKIGAHAHTTDRSCANKIVESKKAKYVNKPKARVFLGFVGALLVGIIGTLPYLYLGYKDYPCFFAAFLIPLFCFFGYGLFGGKPSIGKIIICLLMPVLLFAAASAGLLGYSVFTQWYDAGYVFTIKDLLTTVWQNLLTSSALRETFIYRQVLFGGIFVLAGYVFTLPTCYKRPIPYFCILKAVK